MLLRLLIILFIAILSCDQQPLLVYAGQVNENSTQEDLENTVFEIRKY